MNSVLKTLISTIIFYILTKLIFCFVSFVYIEGDIILDIESGREQELGAAPTQHFTVIFNSFVMMTLFNEMNARKIHGQRNVFEGLFTNPIFYSIWIGTAISQVILFVFSHHIYVKHMSQSTLFSWKKNK